MTVSQKRREEQTKKVLFDFYNMVTKTNKTKVVHHLSKKHKLSERQIWLILKDNGKWKAEQK